VKHKLRPAEKMKRYSEIRKNELSEYLNDFLKKENQVLRNCPACDVKEYNLEFTKEGFKYVKCNQCQCTYVNPVPTSELLYRFYDKFESLQYFYEEILLPTKNERKKIFKERVNKLGNFVDKGASILEIGSSIGFFVGESLAQGYKISGVEPNTKLVNYVREKFRVEIYQGLFEDVVINDKFDVVVMWEVIEHIVDPITVLKKASNVLNHKGIFVATLPNYGGVEYRVVGKEHEMIEAPSHINYFNLDNIAKLLDRAGFRLIHTSTPGILDFVNIMQAVELENNDSIASKFLLEIKMSMSESQFSRLDEVLTQLIQESGLSGNMFIVAEKR
jgi:2-polyprenyl-3-methyl-5-hydroxy-6-metoxy-1,4-benzoquinol methylase